MENENRTLGQPVHENFTKKGGGIGYFGNEEEAYALY